MQCRALLGRELIEPDAVIVTPIKSIYKKLISAYQSIDERTECFYRNALIDLPNLGASRQILFVVTPQGIQAQDLMYVLSNTHIIHIGFAGSISEEFDIGDVTECTVAFTENCNSYNLTPLSRHPNCVCGYSPCLLGDVADSHVRIAKKLGCHLVDMEVAYCAMAAAQNHLKLSALLLVTDCPPSRGFWQLDDVDRGKMNAGLQKTLDTVISICNEI